MKRSVEKTFVEMNRIGLAHDACDETCCSETLKYTEKSNNIKNRSVKKEIVAELVDQGFTIESICRILNETRELFVQ